MLEVFDPEYRPSRAEAGVRPLVVHRIDAATRIGLPLLVRSSLLYSCETSQITGGLKTILTVLVFALAGC